MLAAKSNTMKRVFFIDRPWLCYLPPWPSAFPAEAPHEMTFLLRPIDYSESLGCSLLSRQSIEFQSDWSLFPLR
jgi:hypothetical protein